MRNLIISPAQEPSRPERTKIIPYPFSFLTFCSLHKSLSRFPELCVAIIYYLQIIIIHIWNSTLRKKCILINTHCNISQLLLKRLLIIQYYNILQLCIFRKNTIQHFQFFIQPNSNCGIISFFSFIMLHVNTLYICSISTSDYLSVNTKYEKHMIMYSIFLSLIALPSLIITTLTSFEKFCYHSEHFNNCFPYVFMRSVFPDSQRFNLFLLCSL